MQKNKKASILLWAVFLSLIISISFISINSKILKTINSNQEIKNINNNYFKIQELLYTSKNDNQNFKNFEIQIENKTLIKTLKKYETYNILFPNNSNISLKLLNSSVIFYNTGTTNTGILDTNNNEINTQINSGKKLILQNYGGYAKIKIISDNKFEIDKKRYKIIKKIGNKNIIKTSGFLN